MSITNRTAQLSDARYVTIEKAAELINRTPHSIRQLIGRGKITKFKKGRNLFAVLDSVLTYHARKKNFPSWEENVHKIKNKTFVSIEFASSELKVQHSYICRLVLNKSLEGYVTASGDIMISRDSINSYLRTPDAATDDL